MTTESLVLIGTQIISAIGYFISVKYQSQKIQTLQHAIESQKNLLDIHASTIKTFEDYKKLINLTDVEKNIQLKIDNLHLEYKKIIELREKEVADSAIKSAAKTFQVENQKMLRAWNELVNINAQFIMGRYPDKTNTSERDEFILKLIPFNAEYIIPMINAWNNGQLNEFIQQNSADEFLSNDNTQAE